MENKTLNLLVIEEGGAFSIGKGGSIDSDIHVLYPNCSITNLAEIIHNGENDEGLEFDFDDVQVTTKSHAYLLSQLEDIDQVLVVAHGNEFQIKRYIDMGANHLWLYAFIHVLCKNKSKTVREQSPEKDLINLLYRRASGTYGRYPVLIKVNRDYDDLYDSCFTINAKSNTNSITHDTITFEKMEKDIIFPLMDIYDDMNMYWDIQAFTVHEEVEAVSVDDAHEVEACAYDETKESTWENPWAVKYYSDDRGRPIVGMFDSFSLTHQHTGLGKTAILDEDAIAEIAAKNKVAGGTASDFGTRLHEALFNNVDGIKSGEFITFPAVSGYGKTNNPMILTQRVRRVDRVNIAETLRTNSELPTPKRQLLFIKH